MQINWISLYGLLAVVFLAACSPAELDMPNDFSLVFSWDTGALPPQYCYRYVIAIGPGPQGEFAYAPGLGGDDTGMWVTPLDISTADLRALFDRFDQIGLFGRKWKSAQIRLGGSSTSLVITAFGMDHFVPATSTLEGADLQTAQEALDFIRTFVPQRIWDEMDARQAVYEESWKD